jgi:outer membrane protein
LRRLPIGICLALFATSAAAQSAERPAEVLTLAEALETARENNPGYRIALADLEIADARDRGVWSHFLPSVSLSWSTGLSQSRRYTGVDEFDRPIIRADPLVYTSSGSSQSIGLESITLFDGGRTFAAARASRATAGAIRAHVADEAATLEAELATRYYAAVVAEAEIALAERMLQSATELLEGTKRLLRIGRRDPVDLLGAELQVAEREHALEGARGAARMARLSLGQAMGESSEVERALVDILPSAFDPATIDAAALIAGATAASPRVTALDARARVAGHQLSVARSGRWPSVGLGFSTSRAFGGSGSDAFFDPNPPDQSYGLSLSFRLPLFSQFQVGDAITEARVAKLTADETLRSGQLQVEAEIQGALIDLENADRDIGLAQRTADLSARRLELAQERYLLGGSTFGELQSAVEDSYQREHAVLTARHRFATALLTLETVAGRRVR